MGQTVCVVRTRTDLFRFRVEIFQEVANGSRRKTRLRDYEWTTMIPGAQGEALGHHSTRNEL